MASEAKRALIRIGSNYIRLFASVLLGLILVRQILGALGTEAFGLYALIGSGVGFAKMFVEIVRRSMNRELGAAWHDPTPGEFQRVYNSALVICFFLSLISIGMFAILYSIIPLLQIPEYLVTAARIFIIAHAIETGVLVLTAAPYNMFQVTERMGLYNIWRTMDRVIVVLIALVLFTFLGINDPAHGLTLFGVWSAVFQIAMYFTVAAIMFRLEPRTRPRLSLRTAAARRSILGTGGWNAAVTTALNLHIRTDQFIMNIFFGVIGNAMFGLAAQLGSYIRMLTMGVTDGLDAVSARMSTADQATQTSTVNDLVRHTTRLNAFIALPAGLMVYLVAEPFMDVWVGDRVKDPTIIPVAATLMKILSVGLTCRAISDGWIRILYGAGFINRYAPYVVLGGVLNPIIAVVLLYTLPSPYHLYGPAVSYSFIFCSIHMFIVPIIAGRVLTISDRDLLVPIFRPLIATALCSPIIFLWTNWIDRWNIVNLTGLGIAFGMAYAALTWFYIMSRSERRRVTNAVLRQLGRKPPVSGRRRQVPPAPAPSPESSPETVSVGRTNSTTTGE